MQISRRLAAAVFAATAFSSPLNAQVARLVRDLNPGPSGSSPVFQELAGSAFILTRDPTVSLWRSDGSDAGTVLVTSEAAGTLPASGLVPAAGRLFWVEGLTSPPYYTYPTWLMATVGTAARTGPVAFPPGLSSTNVTELVGALRQVFFETWVEGGGPAVARADGTVIGTRLLAEFPPATLGSISAFHESAAWLVGPSGSAFQLWMSDGTPEGTRLVKQLTSRYPPYCDTSIRRLGRSLVFLADDGSSGCSIWVSDGTTAGTRPVRLIGPGGIEMFPIASSRGILYFTVGQNLWRTDGTTAGTYVLKSGIGWYPLAIGTREGAYFSVTGDGPTEQLWFTDGTVAGTALMHDFATPYFTAMLLSLSNVNGRLLAISSSAVAPPGFDSWTSDGTPAGTTSVPLEPLLQGTPFPYRGATLMAGSDPSGSEPWAVDASGFSAYVPPTRLSLVPACRLVDTRRASDFLGGPPVFANEPRFFPVGGACGIPSTARALAANVTVVGATVEGHLRLHASDVGAPDASVMNFRAGQTRANNTTIALSGDAEMTVRYETATGVGAVDVIVDVVGYYE